MRALNNQVGGDHYKKMKCQPIFLCNSVGLVYGFTGGNIAKYLCRFPHKGKPVEDLQKALHYIALHKEVYERPGEVKTDYLRNMTLHVERYISENKLPGYHADMLRMLVTALISGEFGALVDRVNAEIATFTQCGDAKVGRGVRPCGINPTLDNAKVDDGYTDIQSQAGEYPDVRIGIDVWGMNLK